MSKVITFSRNFQKSHPKAGEQTYFVDRIWKWYYDEFGGDVRDLLWYNEQYDNLFGVDEMKNIHNFNPKFHTIRSGARFNIGDWFSPRIWTGKPYASKQLEIAPLIQVKRVFSIRVLVQDYGKLGLQTTISINGKPFFDIETLARNDGLSVDDFLKWFYNKKEEPFIGQIICWSDEVVY